jgi:hypothetical protein
MPQEQGRAGKLPGVDAVGRKESEDLQAVKVQKVREIPYLEKEMSVPLEEKESLILAWKFLLRLSLPHETKGVPGYVRKEARQILRHYPGPTSIGLFWKKKP